MTLNHQLQDNNEKMEKYRQLTLLLEKKILKISSDNEKLAAR